MTGILTLPDGTAIPLSAIMLTTLKGLISGTAQLTPRDAEAVRAQARATAQLKLEDGRSAPIRVGGVRPGHSSQSQDAPVSFHFQLIEGWD
jgi:hypothetical protein